MNFKRAFIFVFFFSCSLMGKPIILWDIHDVLTEPHDRIIAFFTFPHMKELVSHISWPFLKELIHIAPSFFSDLSSEELIHFALKHNNPYLAELITSIANAQQPILGMKELVQELAQLGYEQHIASNIGFISFHRLINPEKYPQIAPLFKPMNIEKSMVVSNDHGQFLTKPDPRFFKQYLKKNNIDLKKQSVLFIDDRPANIRVAKQLGFDTIRFKNPRQLREALRSYGIMVKAPRYRFSSPKQHHPLYNPDSFVHAIHLRAPDDAS
jgi:FMN phosphatase YigB (HAD superfamily)